MSIRQGILALLSEGERYGYQLRQEFEARTGGIWPLNIGQVYTTLSRLQRDGLVVEAGRQDDGSVVYALTDAGRAEAGRWWETPVDRGTPTRDEVAIKISLAVTSPGVDVATVVQRQRAETVRALQTYVRQQSEVPDPPKDDDLAWLVVLDSRIYAAEAEVRWLDHVEERLRHLRPENPTPGTTAPTKGPR